MNLLEAFVKLDEDAFDTTPKGIEDLSDFMDDADVVDDEIEIIDPDINFDDDDTMPLDDEESEEENAHVGQLVLQCNTCNALIYKDKDEVELDDEGNVEEEECPNCHNVSKFDVIGKICTVDDLEDELEGDEEESEEKEEDESEKPEEESEEEVEKDEEEFDESLRRPRNKSLKESVKQPDFDIEPDEVAIYLFPKLEPEDISVARNFNLSVDNEYDDVDTALIGKFKDLKNFATNYLDYQLVDGYLLDKDGMRIPSEETFRKFQDRKYKNKKYPGFDESLRKSRKIREAFEIDDSIIKEAEDIVNNADLTMTSIEEDGDDGGYIEITDKNSGMNFWIEYWPSNGDWDMNWNQYIFYNNHEDKLRSAIQDDPDFASWAFDIARDNLPMLVEESCNKKKSRKSVKESIRRPNRKTLKENRQQLNEGPGAGYTVSGDLTDIRINSFDFKVNGDEATVNCDIDAALENVEAYSYYYGGEVGYEVPVKITQVSYYIYDDSQLNDSDVEEELEYDLSHLKFKALVGGGWSHFTFDGNLEVKDIRHWNGEDSDIFNVIMHCTDEEDIQFIDDLVTGNSEYSEKNEEEFDESLRRNRKVRKESLRRPDKNRRLVEAPAGDFSYFKSNGNDEMSYNRDALRYAKSLLKRHYLDKVQSSSMDDFSKNIGILNDAVKFVEEEFGQDIKSSGSIPRYRELNQEGPVNTICNGYLDLCNDIEKSFNDCYYIWFNSCRDGDDKYTQTPPGLDYIATFSIFDESCIFKIRTTPEGIEEYTRFINLPDSVNCKNTYKLAENIVSLIPELKSQFFTFNERKLDEISIRLNQKLDRSLFTFIPLDELREKIKQSMVLKESIRRPRNKSLKESWVEEWWGQTEENPREFARQYGLKAERLDKRNDEILYRFTGKLEDIQSAMEDGYFYSLDFDNDSTASPDVFGIDEELKKSKKKSCKESAEKDRIINDIKKLKKESLKESSDTPSKETIKDCIEDYKENAFGFDGIKDYVDTQFPKHSSDFKKALIKAMRKQFESLKEDLEDITVNTDEETIQITQKEDGGVAVETSPKELDEPSMEEPMFEEHPVEGDEISGDEEVIEPLTDEEEEKIAEENPESEEGEEDEGDEDEEEIEDIDSDSFDELGESYLKESYENVKSFKTSKVYKKNAKLVVEGIVSFKSGKNKKTSFIFESAHNKSKKKVLLGENKQITPNSKSFRLRGVVKNKKMVCESLRYNYKEGKNRVSGVCRVK